MIQLTSRDELRAWRDRLPPGAGVGFVPTMGFLHAGHMALVQRAVADNDVAIASIFVNPAQFDRPGDLEAYPRDLPRDLAMLAEAGCGAVFAPPAGDMYGELHGTYVDPGPVAAPLEGASRPGHFRGVATIVLKLFNLVRPARAYFGQKDAQQLAVVRSVVRDLDVPLEVVGMPTVREHDGLAMSSRNTRLGSAQRAAAPVVYRALLAARDAHAAGQRDASALRRAMADTVAREPLAETEYVSIADPDTFAELDRIEGAALASLAVRFGPVRLIDNLLLDQAPAAG